MSIVMLSCAAVVVLAALAGLRHLPGRATPDDTPPPRGPATANLSVNAVRAEKTSAHVARPFGPRHRRHY